MIFFSFKKFKSGFNPLDNPDVVDIYDAWEEANHTYEPARTLVSYSTSGGNTVVTCVENPTRFSNTAPADVVIINSGDAQIDGERTVTAVSGATFTFSNPLGNPTGGSVGVTGTADWKLAKVKSVMGVKGIYAFTNPFSAANSPHWDASAKQMLWLSGRGARLEMATGFRAEFHNKEFGFLFVVRRSETASLIRTFVAREDLNLQDSFVMGWTTSNNQVIGSNVGNGSTTKNTTWTDSSNNNLQPKMVWYNGKSNLTELWVNDTTAPRVSNTNDGLLTPTTQARHGLSSAGGFLGWINYCLLTTKVLEPEYVEQVKLWIQEKRGVTMG
jgi:hypothetical protein